jgi:hypothetical protein
LLSFPETSDDDTPSPQASTNADQMRCKRKRTNPARAKAGSARYKCTFDVEWTKIWPFIVKGQNTSCFWCNTCRIESKCTHQGKRDVQRHIDSAGHQSKTKDVVGNSSMKNFVRPSGSSTMSSLEFQTRRAEVKMAATMAHHNVPIAFSDHLSPLFHQMFPDSEIAKHYSSARTKTSCILNMAMKPYFQSALVSEMKTGPFTLSIGGSNDTGLEKMNPLTVKVYDVNRQRVEHKFLDMCTTSGKGCGTALGIFGKMDEVLTTHSIPWDNCVALSVDNTSVNLGVRNSLKVHTCKKHSGIYVFGCPCHILHNCASKAGTAFGNSTGFDVQDLCVDAFYWFEYSTNRKGGLESFCIFCDTEYKQVIKYCSTRWLSLESSITRLLRMYEPLKSYFLSNSESQPRFKRLRTAFEDPMTEVYLLFFQATLPLFNRLNLLLQRSDPSIHLIFSQIRAFLKTLLCKFVLPTIVSTADDITAVEYTLPENQLSDDKLFVGLITRQTLVRLLNDGSVGPEAVNKFTKSARLFFHTATAYALSHLPFDDDLLRNAQFVDWPKRLETDFTQVQYFVERYPKLCPFNDPHEQERLFLEFTEFQTLKNDFFPKHVLDEATVAESVTNTDTNGSPIVYHRLDILWGFVATYKDATGMFVFPRLSVVAKLVLCLPHSNADEERVFSLVKHNKTPVRNSLSLDGTLSSILTVKMNSSEPCYKFEPPTDVVLKSRNVTSEYNKEHSGSSVT